MTGCTENRKIRKLSTTDDNYKIKLTTVWDSQIVDIHAQ